MIEPTPVVVPRIPCSSVTLSKPPVLWGVPDATAPVGPNGLPVRWILTTDTIADLGAYIINLHNVIASLQTCLGVK